MGSCYLRHTSKGGVPPSLLWVISRHFAKSNQCPLYLRKRTHDENNRDCVGRTLGLPASPRQLRRLCAKRLTGAGTLDFFAEFFGRPALPRLVNLSSTTPLQQRRIKTLLSMLSIIRRFSRW